MAAGGVSASKTSAKYWEGKLFKRSYKRGDGSDVILADWYVALCHQGANRTVCLQTPVKVLAAQRAREAYLLLKSQGWDAMWAAFKVRKSKVDKCPQKPYDEDIPLTVGDYIIRVTRIAKFSDSPTSCAE